MIYGYARVSTNKQGLNGNSLEEQRQILNRHNVDEIVEEVYTGTTTSRPKFTELCEKLQAGDTLVVSKLDRFARTVTEGLEMIQNLQKRDVKVEIDNIPGTIENTPNGQAFLGMMLVFAEFERNMIVERTQNGKAIARANGKRVDGRPFKFTEAQLNHAIELLKAGNSYTEVSKMTGISVSTLTREMRKRKAASI